MKIILRKFRRSNCRDDDGLGCCVPEVGFRKESWVSFGFKYTTIEHSQMSFYLPFSTPAGSQRGKITNEISSRFFPGRNKRIVHITLLPSLS